MNARLKNNQGIALVMLIMLMVILLSATGAGLLFSGLNLKVASNLKAGSAALHVADAGIQHALAIIPVGTEFDTLLAGSVSGFPLVSGKPTLTGSLSGYTYTVVAENDPSDSGGSTDDSNRIVVFTSTATEPNGSKRTIKAYVGRSEVYIPPGPVYLPGQSQYVDTRFTGTSFDIDGSDTIPGQTPGSGSASPIPGISTSTSTGDSISGASGTLSSSQYPLVSGQGTDPSVNTTSSIYNFDVQQTANNIIASGIEGVTMQTLNPGNYSSGIWGTELARKITRITGNATLTGDLTGYGVLIVEGTMTVRGSFSFKGIVIGLSDVDFKGSGDSGTATVWGAVFVKESTTSDPGMEFQIGGAAKIYYSSQTLGTVSSTWGSTLPKAAKVIAWHEMMI